MPDDNFPRRFFLDPRFNLSSDEFQAADDPFAHKNRITERTSELEGSTIFAAIVLCTHGQH